MTARHLTEERILRGRNAARLLQKAEQIAGQCAQAIAQAGGLEKAETQLRQILDDNLGRYEYIALFDEKGLALLHTNRLREGMLFNDPVGMKAVKTAVPLAQIFHRDTGEVILDGACPVVVKGERICTVRVGAVLVRGKVLPKIVLATIGPVLVSSGVVALMGKADWSLFWWPLLGTVLGIGGALWLNLLFYRALGEFYNSTRALAAGNLSYLAKPRSTDELGQIAFEMNKVSLGLKAIIGELAEIASRVLEAGKEQAKATEEVSKAAEQISVAVSQMASGAQDQMKAMDEANGIAEEIGRAMDKMKNYSQETVRLARKALEAAASGAEAVTRSVGQMETIRRSVELSAQVINDLEVKSQQIGKIINTITDIADQTNLLALNAAIEAARAGEQGKGFAVVAEEVRKLAEEASRSANEIMNIITQTQAKTKEAVEAMEQGAQQVQVGTEVINETGEAIERIKLVVEETARQVEGNAKLVEKLYAGTERLARHVERTLEVSREAAAAAQNVAGSVEEQTAASEEIAAKANGLLEAAQHLEKMVKRFRY
ncbi:methyl-accepting chemotaxis protein [Calderihabitans maritimus]|uniref:Methyl-accepting chemotaxis protein n=1 Tax=Calderihabitans maritimus TaxID=1246530 RepID=A0A1Z5HUC4_9FIRM|nr:methyl-accepting chemotaxis protein [Calderihabitans maritimus]GAW93008.1 methyl-accepting chemotaxis protein [Calderihabitans maritimus]